MGTILKLALAIEIKQEMGVFMFTHDLLCPYRSIKEHDYVLEEMDLLSLRWNNQLIWDVQRITRCAVKGNERRRFAFQSQRNVQSMTFE